MMLVQRKLLVCGREFHPGAQPRSHTKVMFEIVKAGGIMMGPIILASIVTAAIFLERLWTLQTKRVLPAELTEKVWRWVEQGQIQDKHIAALQQNSPLARSWPRAWPIAIAIAS